MGWGEIWAGVWDGHVVKLGCDDGCPTINIVKFMEFQQKQIKIKLKNNESRDGKKLA